MASPLPSRGPHGGERSKWLHHRCFLGVPMVGRDQYGCITPAFSGSPCSGEKRDGKWVKVGDNSNMPHPKCIRSKKKNPVWNKKLVERGILHIPNRKGRAKSVDYGSVSKMAQKHAWRAPSALPLPSRVDPQNMQCSPNHQASSHWENMQPVWLAESSPQGYKESSLKGAPAKKRRRKHNTTTHYQKKSGSDPPPCDSLEMKR